METACKVCGGAHTTGACTENPKPTSTDQQAETTGSAETTEQVDPERINTFILKLAEAPNISGNEATDAIIKQIQLLEGDQNFPELLAALDPEQYHPQTKSLSEEGKQRLQAALDRYVKERGQK